MFLIMNETTTIKKKRHIRARPNQIKMIVETMEQNPFLNESKISSRYTAAKRSEDWEKLAQKLNCSGGAIKSVKVWQKCWSDKKGEVKRKNNAIKAARLKSGDINDDEEMKLNPLEQRIILLIAPETTEGLEKPSIEESDSQSKIQEFVIPKVEDVRSELATSSVNGSSDIISASQSSYQEFNENDSEQYLLPDTPSLLSGTEESHQPESIPLQLNTSQVRLQSLRKKNVDLKVEDCPTSPVENSNAASSTIPTLPLECNQTELEESFRSDSPSHLPNTKESCQPESFLPYVNIKVEDCSASPVDSNRLTNSNVTSTFLIFHQQSNPTDVVNSLQTDPQSQLPITEEPCQPESILPSQSLLQLRTQETRPRPKKERTKPLLLKSDNAQKLVDSQTKMAAALTRCAAALEKRNEIQERALEIAKRKVDVQERLLKIKKEKADAFIGILSALKR